MKKQTIKQEKPTVRQDRKFDHLIDGAIEVVQFDNSRNLYPYDALIVVGGGLDTDVTINKFRENQQSWSILAALPKKILSITELSKLDDINWRNSHSHRWNESRLCNEYGLPTNNHVLIDLAYMLRHANEEVVPSLMSGAEVYLWRFRNCKDSGTNPFYIKAGIAFAGDSPETELYYNLPFMDTSARPLREVMPAKVESIKRIMPGTLFTSAAIQCIKERGICLN